MSAPVRPICGEPMAFYELDRPRDDLNPVCWRPPHAGTRHMSLASLEHEREYRRAYDRARRQAAGMSDPAARVRS